MIPSSKIAPSHPDIFGRMPATYQRVMFNGVPYWKGGDATLYYYESATPPVEPIALGNEVTGLFPDWEARLAPILSSYRAVSKSRLRAKPALKN